MMIMMKMLMMIVSMMMVEEEDDVEYAFSKMMLRSMKNDKYELSNDEIVTTLSYFSA